MGFALVCRLPARRFCGVNRMPSAGCNELDSGCGVASKRDKWVALTSFRECETTFALYIELII
jgi:hypothetical protein